MEIKHYIHQFTQNIYASFNPGRLTVSNFKLFVIFIKCESIFKTTFLKLIIIDSFFCIIIFQNQTSETL